MLFSVLLDRGDTTNTYRYRATTTAAAAVLQLIEVFELKSRATIASSLIALPEVSESLKDQVLSECRKLAVLPETTTVSIRTESK